MNNNSTEPKDDKLKDNEQFLIIDEAWQFINTEIVENLDADAIERRESQGKVTNEIYAIVRQARIDSI